MMRLTESEKSLFLVGIRMGFLYAKNGLSIKEAVEKAEKEVEIAEKKTEKNK